VSITLEPKIVDRLLGTQRRLRSIQPQVKFLLSGFFAMDTVGMALVVGGMAFLFSGLIFLIPVGGSRPAPGESLEDSQERIEQYLREMDRDRGEIDR
jgi:hypothetical protein